MSWEVTAKVSGGCKYSTEETEAYMRAAKALSHQADALNRAHDSVRALSPSAFLLPLCVVGHRLAVRIKPLLQCHGSHRTAIRPARRTM